MTNGTSEEINVDDLLDFDEEETAVATSSEIEREQTEKMIQYRRVKDLILSPEVAKAISQGYDYSEIAEVLGVSESTVRKYATTSDMQVLLDRESRRLLKHLTSRDLKEEKYRDLSVSLGVLLDKSRQIRNEPEDEDRRESATDIINSLANLLHGQSARGSWPPVIDVPGRDVTDGLPGLHGESNEEGPVESQDSSDDGSKSESE